MAFAVAEILAWTGGRVVNSVLLGPAQEKIQVTKPAPLGAARPGDLAFFFNKAYRDELATASPGVLITGEDFVKPLEAASLPFWKTCAVIACRDPYIAMALLSEKFAGALSTVAHPPGASRGDSRIHASAVIHASAKIAAGVQVGAHCVIEAEARIGAGSVLYPGCYVGPSCSLGEDCVLFPGVTLYEWTELGKRVRIHAGAVLGSDGFGYAPVKAPGAEGGKPGVVGHQKIYHLGRVVVGDDVEIGANSCVDRSTFGETRIDRNSKLDNLVHLGHNARLEEGAIVCGGTCLAGNASVGKYAYVGGLTGVANQVHVGDGASVGALTLVTKDVPPGSTAVGNPQREYREHFKAHATLSRLVKSRGEKNE